MVRKRPATVRFGRSFGRDTGTIWNVKWTSPKRFKKIYNVAGLMVGKKNDTVVLSEDSMSEAKAKELARDLVKKKGYKVSSVLKLVGDYDRA